jgi:hypothetical protein
MANTLAIIGCERAIWLAREGIKARRPKSVNAVRRIVAPSVRY